MAEVVDQEVRIYLLERRIGEHVYGDQICARSWKEAEDVAAGLSLLLETEVKVLGTLEGSQCAVCGKEETIGRQLGMDEWPDIVAD